MDASTTDFNYRVSLGRSRLAGLFIVAAGMGTLALVASLPIDPRPQLFVVAWTGFAMLDAFRAVALRRGRRGVHGICLRGGSIAVLGEGVIREGPLRDGSFVSPWLTVIRWRPAPSRFDRTVVVLPDMLPREDYRRLRVLLRWSEPGTDPSFCTGER